MNVCKYWRGAWGGWRRLARIYMRMEPPRVASSHSADNRTTRSNSHQMWSLIFTYRIGNAPPIVIGKRVRAAQPIINMTVASLRKLHFGPVTFVDYDFVQVHPSEI